MDDNATAAALAARFLLAARFPTAGLSEERWQTLVVGTHDAVARDAVDFVNQPGVRDRLRMPGFTTWAEAVAWIVNKNEASFDPLAVQRLRSRSFTQVIDGSHADVCLVLAKALGGAKAVTPPDRGHDRSPLSPEERQRAFKAITDALDLLPQDASREQVVAKACELNGSSRGIKSTIDAHPAWRNRVAQRKRARVTTGSELTQAFLHASDCETSVNSEETKEAVEAVIDVLMKNSMTEADAQALVEAEPARAAKIAMELDSTLAARLRPEA